MVETRLDENHPAHAGIRATLIGIGINGLLCAGKAAAGVAGNSYALVADAAESLTDIFSSIIVYIGLRLAARPADANHPHGHGKAEPLAALFVALVLIGVAILIGIQSVERIFVPHPPPAPWTLAVLIVVVVIKGSLSRYSLQVAREIRSSAVHNDAQHHLNDAITSIAAFVGISVALIGTHYSGSWRWATADDWAALATAMLIVFQGSRMLKEAVYELSDASPDESLEMEIRRVAATVPEVANLDKCFVRKMGFDFYCELDIRVDRNMPVYRAHEIAHRVQDTVRDQLANRRVVRVLVHVEPTLGG